MKSALLACVFGITIFWCLTFSIEALEKKEDESLLFLMAARNAAKAGWTNKAIQRYEAYLKKNPDDEVVVLEFADFLQDRGHFRKAEMHYDMLIRKIENMPVRKDDFAKKLMLNAARNAVKNKKDDRAVEYYKQALSFDRGDLKVAEEVAGVFAGLERFGEALELCEKILQVDPRNLEGSTLKINLLVRQKKYAEAREMLARIPYEENNLKLLQLAAEVDAWSGNYDEAIEKYQKLVSRFPESRDIWSQYIKVLSWSKKWPLLLDTIQDQGNIIEITDDIRSMLVDAYLSVGQEEKAIEVWKTIQRESDAWHATALMIVDKFLSHRKLTEASNVLEEIVSASKPVPEIHLLAKLAMIYAYRGMPGKGFEILNRFTFSPQSKSIIDMTKAEILALTGRYEDALAILHTLEGDKDIGLRPRIIELECYCALEKDEMLLEKSSLILPKLSPVERDEKLKVLTLRVLSQIRMGLFKEVEEEIELLSKLDKKDFGPAILTVLLHDAERQLGEYEKSIRILGKLLSEFSAETEMVRPQLLDNVPLAVWKAADEAAMHRNPEVTEQRAKAEYKACNFEQSLSLYEALVEKNKDTGNILGMVECYLNLNEEADACKLFEEIQVLNLPEKEIARYFEALVKLKRNKQALYVGLSVFPKDVSQKTDVRAIMVIANIQSGDNDVANGIMKKYLSDRQEDRAVFQTIVERVGYFDRGKKSTNYEFAKDWLRQAVEQYPDDRELRYQYAKLMATHCDYDLAAEQFSILQRDGLKDVRILRWLAQVNSWRYEYDESFQWYDLYLKERPPDFKRRREVARVYGWALHLREANEAYKNLCRDYPEDPEIYWEWEAKRNNWLGRKRTAISFYNKLVERHPEDTEFLFDLGQMYSQLNVSSKAEDAYNKLLVYAPEHKRAQFAEESEQWKRRQSVWLKQSYLHQKGSGDEFGNFEITMFRTDVDYSLARFSEAMDLSLGLGNTIFKFTEHGGSSAEHLTLHAKKYFENGITAYLDGELSTYSENRHETGQFETGVSYRIYDRFDVSLLGGREDVLQNFNTLRNSRSRYYTGGRFAWDISQRIDISSQVKKYWFDDSNNGIEDDTIIGYKLSLYPKILKFIVEVYGFDTHARQDEYWSPNSYRKYMGGVVCRQYLGEEHFSGAPKLYYELAVKQGVDSDGVDFTEPKFEFGWDNQRRWNVGLEIKPVQSSVYDEEQASVFLNVRF
ncbi:MAG: tetratricopeptide repeat protein [Candidatus Brocadia sp.]|nr:tetratricopeptide repeat protein [Candidatus Brocadia sp.]